MAKRIFVSITCFASLFLVVGFATHGDSSASGFNPPKGFFLYKSAPKERSGGRGVAIQPDGKIVVMGVSYNGTNHRTLVLRLNSDGTRDNTFGIGSVFTYGDKGKGNNYGSGIALQPDGKIVVVGDSHYAKSRDILVLRYNSDGSLDSSFGKGGIVTHSGLSNADIWGRGVAIQPDGKIVMVGVSNTAKKCDVLTVRNNAEGHWDKAL